MNKSLTLCGLILLAAGLAGAATTSRLTGAVVDQDGAPLPGVTVTLSSEVLIGGPQAQVTDAAGSFQFLLLPPGRYRVDTELAGYLPAGVEARVALDRATAVQVRLVRREFAGSIEVSAVAPLVDTTQVNSGDSYDEAFLQHAAVGMDGRDYLSVIGQAAGSVGSGNVRVMGGVQSDNVYLVDGLNTTDPATATFATLVNYDSIQEVSIQTTGFEAEFGQALGGVVNLVTRAGGNAFSGSLDVRYRDEGFAEGGEHWDPEVNVSSLRKVSATLGGPLLRDRLWFFLSVGNTLSKATPQGSPVTFEFDGYEWLGKLTWQASDASRVTVKAWGDPAEIHNSNASRYITAEAGAKQDQGGNIYHAELSSVLSDAWLLTFQAGANRQYLDGYPMSGRTDLPAYLDGDLEAPNGVWFNNWLDAQYSDRDRDQYRAVASWFLDGAAGSHEVKGGVEYSGVDFGFRQFYPGGAWFEVYEYRGAHPGGSGLNDVDGDGYTDYRMHRGLPDAGEWGESSGDLWTAFAQDTWRPLPSLTVKPGVRLDTAEYANLLGQSVADFQFWQPRVGVAWDLVGTGRSVLRASWGRFMHPASVNLADTVNGRAQYGSLEYTGYESYCRDYFPPGSNFCNREWLAQNRALDGQEVVTVDAAGNEHYWYLTSQVGTDPFQTVDTLGVGRLEPAWAESLTLAFEQQLGAETSVSVEYVHKDTRDLLEDACVNNAWLWDPGAPRPSFDDPGTWTSAAGCTGYVLLNPPGERREYEAYIAQVEARTGALHLMGSYTYATSRGNSQSEAWDTYASAPYDFFPLDVYNIYGYLSDDRRHRVKLNGYLLLPLDFTVGFSGFWSSSPALSVYASCANTTEEALAEGGYDPRLVDYCSVDSASWEGYFLLPRGARRGSSNSQVDVSVAKAFRFKGVSLELNLAVVNLLGSERVVQYQTYELLPDSNELNPDGTPNPNYDPDNVWGAPLSWQQPRRYEVGMRVEF